VGGDETSSISSSTTCVDSNADGVSHDCESPPEVFLPTELIHRCEYREHRSRKGCHYLLRRESKSEPRERNMRGSSLVPRDFQEVRNLD